MFIKKISFANHNLWGNIEFDFCDSNGIPYNTVIIAGENGTGKSRLLNFIHNIPQNFYPKLTSDLQQELTLQLNNNEILLLQDSVGDLLHNISLPKYIDLIIFTDFSKSPLDWQAVQSQVRFELNGKMEEIKFPSYFLVKGKFSENLKIIFSEVEVNYIPDKISTTSSLDVDQAFGSTKSTTNLATEITQLLIDIESLDNSDFAEWARNNSDKTVNEGITDKRMARFKKAFHSMFPSKRYQKIDNAFGSKQVIFKEGNNLMSIEQLSSGEKQIVFRGGFLLRDQLIYNQSVVLIDEPELSLHPSWQLKILGFYKKLFTDSNDIQQSQLFVTTHSPFIVHNQNSDTDKIIVLAKSDKDVIVQKEPEFYNWTSKTAVTEAFDVKLDFENHKLVVFVEGETDEKYINLALKIFNKDTWPIVIKWIGRKDVSGPKFTGDTALNQTKDYLVSNHDLLNNRFLLLYDSDVEKSPENLQNDGIFIRSMPFNDDNKRFRKGIENLLNFPADFQFANFYITNENISGYGEIFSKQTLQKTELCKYIHEEIDIELQKEILSRFENEVFPIFEDILRRVFKDINSN